MEDRTVTFEISLRTIVRVVLVILLILFLFLVRDIVLLLLLSIMIASAVDHPATFLQRWGVPRILSVLLVYVAFFGILTALLFMIIPPLANDIRDLASNFPAWWRAFLSELDRSGFLKSELFLRNLERNLGELSSIIGGGVSKFPELLSNIFGGTISLLSVFLISVYLALQKDGVERFLRLLVPAEPEPYVINLWHRAERTIGYWLRGWVMLSVLVGVVVWIGLSLLGVKYALLLAFIAGLLEIVQIVGPIASGILAISVAMIESPLLALAVGIFFLIVQQIEGNIIVPLIFRKFLGLHPVIVILALLVGARLAGPLGLILAVPVTAVLIEFLNDWSRGKVRL